MLLAGGRLTARDGSWPFQRLYGAAVTQLVRRALDVCMCVCASDRFGRSVDESSRRRRVSAISRA